MSNSLNYQEASWAAWCFLPNIYTNISCLIVPATYIYTLTHRPPTAPSRRSSPTSRSGPPQGLMTTSSCTCVCVCIFCALSDVFFCVLTQVTDLPACLLPALTHSLTHHHTTPLLTHTYTHIHAHIHTQIRARSPQVEQQKRDYPSHIHLPAGSQEGQQGGVRRVREGLIGLIRA